MDFEWNDSLKLGIADIDQQHQRMVDLVNDLADRLKDGAIPDWMTYGKLVVAIEVHIQEHFTSEEELMAKAGYPQLKMHRSEHDLFRRHIEQITENGAKVGKVPLAEIRDFLSGWIVGHVLVEDRRMGQYLLKKDNG